MSFEAVFPQHMRGGKEKKKKNFDHGNVHQERITSESDGQGYTRGSRGGRGHERGRGRDRGDGRGHKHGYMKKREDDKSRKAADNNDNEEYDEGEDSDGTGSVSSECHSKDRNRRGNHHGRRGGQGRKDFRRRGGHDAAHRNAESTAFPGGQAPLSYPQAPIPPLAPYPGPQSFSLPHGGPPPLTGHPNVAQQHVSEQPYMVNQLYPGHLPPPGQPYFPPGPPYVNHQPFGGQPYRQSYVSQPMMNQPHPGLLTAPAQSHIQQSFQQPLPSVPTSGLQSNKTSGFGRHHSVPNLTEEKGKQTPRRKPTHIAESSPDKDANNGSRLGQDGDKENINRQQIKSDPKPNASNADLDSDEWQQVFTFLLREFDGQTKFGTLMSKKDKLLKGLNHDEAAEWLKRNSSKFLVFEKDGKIKFVSIFFRGAKICFNYRNPKYPSCKNPKCTYFHVCRNFICESCSYGPECQFSHNFHSQSNIKVCQELGLQNFTNEDIRKIVACSSVSVCDKYNRSGCSKEDCLQLHVCANHVQQKCTAGEGCKLSHSVKSLEHNQWLLQAFHLMQVPDNTISRMVLIRKDEKEKQEKKEMPAGTEDLQSTKSKKEKKGSKEKMKKTPSNDLQKLDELPMSSPLVQGKPAGVGLSLQHQQDQGERVSLKEDDAKDAAANLSDKLCDQSSVPLPVQKKLADVQENQAEGGQSQQDAGRYTYLCEMFSCTGDCPTGFLCPRYHHRSQPRYQWQIFVFGFWRDFSRMDNWDIERLYCKLSDRETFEVFVEDVGGLRLTINFEALEAIVEDSHGSDIGASDDLVPVRRWSTRSYVDADPEVALKHFTQWVWFYQDDTGKLEPFQPKRLQYTLEEKYVRGEKKYYYEQGQARFVLHLQEGVRVDLGSHGISKLLRRPAFYQDGGAASEISPLLLSEIPRLQHSVPSNWSCVDMYQDFELVELDPTGAEYQDVAHKFHASLDKRRQTILSIFRIQNPALWDKYCSTKRAMTPRDMTQQDVDERQLFHGTPTLDAVRGICANNMDFRRSGENVGAKYGKGSYFSTNSLYSHSYTCGTDSTGNERYMFLARVLVGKYTPGEESFALPPIREGLKRYDSCVDNQTSPTIFVIFELAQSYPEYLLQYKDTQDADKAASKLGNANSLGSLAAMNKGVGGVTTWAPAESSVPSARSIGIITDSSKPDLGLLKLPAADMSLPAPDTPRSLSGDASSRAPNLLQVGAARFASSAYSAIRKDEKCVLS